MTDLIAYTVGYQHEPQEEPFLALAEFEPVVCRIVLISTDANAGYLDGAVRQVSAPPVIGDNISLTGQMMSETINLEVVDVTKQNESYVQKHGGPAYILHCKTV